MNDISSHDNKLGRVELKFGGEINEYKPCIWTNTLPVLNMNITCPAWNEGTYIQVTFLNFNKIEFAIKISLK